MSNDEYQCPECKSTSIEIGYPNIICHACGWSDALLDFPIRYNTHPSYCQRFGQPAPPSEYPTQIMTEVQEIQGRLTFLEELAPPVYDRKRREELQQLTGRVNYLQKKIYSSENKPKEKPAQQRTLKPL